MSDRGDAMKPLVHALQAVFGTMLILGCASSGDLKPEIKPVFMMQHGGNQADGYYQLGRYYQSNGRSKDAEAAYRKALALDDRLAEAHSALGAMYALNRSFVQAMVELNAAVALDPSAPHFRNNLGYAYYLQGKAAEAIANFEIAAALDPANPRTWNNLGLALAQLGKTDRAEEAYARATALASAGAVSGQGRVAGARTAASAGARGFGREWPGVRIGNRRRRNDGHGADASRRNDRACADSCGRSCRVRTVGDGAVEAEPGSGRRGRR